MVETRVAGVLGCHAAHHMAASIITNVCVLCVAAITVRFLTRRYIGEYSSDSGKPD